MRPLISTGSVTRNPDFTDHLRIVRHVPPADLELSIYRAWDERVIDDLHGLPIVVAHADKAIGATLSGDHPELDRFDLNCRIAGALGATTIVLHLWELPDGDRYLERNLAQLPRLARRRRGTGTDSRGRDDPVHPRHATRQRAPRLRA